MTGTRGSLSETEAKAKHDNWGKATKEIARYTMSRKIDKLYVLTLNLFLL